MIEIDVLKLERGTHEGQVSYMLGGKKFWRKQRVGKKDKTAIQPTTRIKTKPKEIPTKITPHNKILNRIQEIMNEAGEGSQFSATVIRNPGNIYTVDLMLNYTSGRGLGSMGAMSVLEINYKSREPAEKLVSEIRQMKPKLNKDNKFKKLNNMDFDGLSDMVNESIDRVSGIYENRNMTADDVLSHIEVLIPKNFIKENEITLTDEFVNRLFNAYKSKYEGKITGNKKFTRKIDYYSGIYD